MQILFNELKNYKISLLLILVATYISTTFELMLPVLLANALNIGIIENYGLNYIKNIVLMMVVFISISIILNFIIGFLINRVSIYASTNIRSNLFDKILSLKTEKKKNFTNASLLTRTNQDIEQIKGFVSSFLSIIFKAPILFISCITILQTLNNNISIIILIIYLIIIVIKLFPLSKCIQNKIDNLNLLVKEKIEGIKIIKSYNNLKQQDNKFKTVNNEYLNTMKKTIKLTSLIFPILNLLVNSLIIIILIMSVNLVKNNALEVGNIIASIQYILQILLSIIMLSMIIILIPKTKVSLSRIKEVMDSESYSTIEQPLNIDINSISFNNISYSYNQNKILNNINLTINKGDKIGIIGPTGSGKSTLIKLLLKDLELQEGNIKINDLDINNLTRKQITTNITYIPQNSTILTGTILENITFANPYITQNELFLAIHTSSLDSFIEKKEEKLNFKLEENGLNLSGGQKQRICIARGLAKNSNTIIFDDSFSSLDYKTEKEIITKLNSYYKEKNIVIISQKISSIQHLDKIAVMDKGKIIALDTHDNLLKTCPLYKEMYTYQKEVLEYDI